MKKIIEKVVVNGETFFTGEIYDKFLVTTPTNEEPYWEIRGLKNGNTLLLIKATGSVYHKTEYENEGGK